MMMFLMNLLKSFMSPLSLYTWETCRVVTYISSVAYKSRCNDSRESNDDGLVILRQSKNVDPGGKWRGKFGRGK